MLLGADSIVVQRNSSSRVGFTLPPKRTPGTLPEPPAGVEADTEEIVRIGPGTLDFTAVPMLRVQLAGARVRTPPVWLLELR